MRNDEKLTSYEGTCLNGPSIILDMAYGKVISRVIITLVLGYLLLFTASGLNQCVETLQILAYSKLSPLHIDIMVMAVMTIYSVKEIAKMVFVFLPSILIVVLFVLSVMLCCSLKRCTATSLPPEKSTRLQSSFRCVGSYQIDPVMRGGIRI
jgi:hypothetical protein